MSLDAHLSIEDGVATVVLTGEADGDSAPALNRVLTAAAEGRPRHLVLEVAGLTYLSSAGLRCLVYAHQRLGRSVGIVLIGAREEVAETIRLTGFDTSVTMRDRAPADPI
jgi:anti-anti-sigma factor